MRKQHGTRWTHEETVSTEQGRYMRTQSAQNKVVT